MHKELAKKANASTMAMTTIHTSEVTRARGRARVSSVGFESAMKLQNGVQVAEPGGWRGGKRCARLPFWAKGLQMRPSSRRMTRIITTRPNPLLG